MVQWCHDSISCRQASSVCLPWGPLGRVAATASEATARWVRLYSCSGVLPRKTAPPGSWR